MIFAIDGLKSASSLFCLMEICLPGSLSAAPDGAFNYCQSGSVRSFWKQSSQWQSPAQRILWKCSAGQYPRLLFSVTYQGITKLPHVPVASFCRLWHLVVDKCYFTNKVLKIFFDADIVLCLYRVTSATPQPPHPPFHLLLRLQYSTNCWMEWLLGRSCRGARKTQSRQRSQWVDERFGTKLMFFVIFNLQLSSNSILNNLFSLQILLQRRWRV